MERSFRGGLGFNVKSPETGKVCQKCGFIVISNLACDTAAAVACDVFHATTVPAFQARTPT